MTDDDKIVRFPCPPGEAEKDNLVSLGEHIMDIMRERRQPGCTTFDAFELYGKVDDPEQKLVNLQIEIINIVQAWICGRVCADSDAAELLEFVDKIWGPGGVKYFREIDPLPVV